VKLNAELGFVGSGRHRDRVGQRVQVAGATGLDNVDVAGAAGARAAGQPSLHAGFRTALSITTSLHHHVGYLTAVGNDKTIP
jgi:hypothetical protein